MRGVGWRNKVAVFEAAETLTEMGQWLLVDEAFFTQGLVLVPLSDDLKEKSHLFSGD